MTPEAKHEGLQVQEEGDEVVVYDPARDVATRLNATAARVWRGCDGRTTVAALASRLEGDDTTREAAVRLALELLDEAGLLRGNRPPDARGGNGEARGPLKRQMDDSGASAIVPTVTMLQGYRPSRHESGSAQCW